MVDGWWMVADRLESEAGDFSPADTSSMTTVLFCRMSGGVRVPGATIPGAHSHIDQGHKALAPG
jgi:hypothetical protein